MVQSMRALAGRWGITRADALGLLGVAIFAGTYPATRIAMAGGVDPVLNASARILGAGLLAALVLTLTRLRHPGWVRWPHWAEVPAFIVTGVGVGLIFPLGLGFALCQVPASHGAVVMAALPLATTMYACLRGGSAWPGLRFWGAGLAAAALVLVFAGRHAGGVTTATPMLADGLLVLAMLGAAMGYVEGARLTTTTRPGWQVISWALVLLVPMVAPVAIVSLIQAQGIGAAAWIGLGYGTLFSMYLGFFPWYRAMQLAGVVRISQIQYVQPFLAIIYAVILLGERVDLVDLLLVLGVVGTIAWGRRRPQPLVDQSMMAGAVRP